MRVYGLTSRNTGDYTPATASTPKASLDRAFGSGHSTPSVIAGLLLIEPVRTPAFADRAAKPRKTTNRQLRAALKRETPAVALVACRCSALLSSNDANATTGCTAMVVPTAANEGYAPGHADSLALWLGDQVAAEADIYDSVTDQLLSAPDLISALGYELVEETTPALV